MSHVRSLTITLAISVMLAVVPAPALAAPVTVNWWHAHGGALGERVNAICEGFNKSQTQYQVVPTYKGNYADTMNAGIAAFRAKTPPHILQVFEVGTATMMAAKGAIVPVGKVLADAGHKFDAKAYIPAVVGYYTAPSGQMLSFPLNSSTTVLNFNKDAFRKAGLDPNKAPANWREQVEFAQKLTKRDASGKVVMPGLVDTHSHIGGVQGADASAPIQPDVRAIDAEALVARAGGFDEERDWDTNFSLREQQLLAISRILIARPTFVFLDRITATLLPEDVERVLRALTDRSITYALFGAVNGDRALFDAVLDIRADGAWEWKSLHGKPLPK